MARTIIAALAAAALVTVTGCDRAEKSGEPAEKTESGAQTLAAALADAPKLSRLADALEGTGLAGAFNGAASYTVLAPSDDAFDKLGSEGAELTKPEQRAAMAAILREHIIPGYITPADIKASLAAHEGKPVKMRTTGEGEVSFASKGEALTVTGADGVVGTISGEPLRAKNGVAIPIDTVLKKLSAS